MKNKKLKKQIKKLKNRMKYLENEMQLLAIVVSDDMTEVENYTEPTEMGWEDLESAWNNNETN